jgi:GDP-mannose 6-dehydrogenase
MRIVVFGLGYVGCTTAACLAYREHSVIGVDIHQEKVDLIQSGKGTFKEEFVHELVHSAVNAGHLTATINHEQALQQADVVFLCIGTPSDKDGKADLTALQRVCSTIGTYLNKHNTFLTLVVRSTVPPGTTEDVLIPLLEKTSGKRAFIDFDVCVNPEFMREGTSVEDFNHPSRTIVGAKTREAAENLRKAYRHVKAPFVHTDIKTAEFIKYVDNSFHALKVAYANEIASICKKLSLNTKQVFDLFLMDKKLNVSEAYLKPGLPFGGSCLPKDLRALQSFVKEKNNYPLLQSILPSNNVRKQEILELIRSHGKKRIGILGVSFKEGTDDLRESQMLGILQVLYKSGYELYIYDSNIKKETILPLNLHYVQSLFPELFSCMRNSLEEVAEKSEVIVIANNSPYFADILPHLTKDHIVLDFHNLLKDETDMNGTIVNPWSSNASS